MSLTSIQFLLFLSVLVVLYYLIPKRFQWILLLFASLIFYCFAGIQHAIYILITATSTYAATRWMQKITNQQKQYLKAHKETLSKEDKSLIKKQNNTKRKAILIGTLVLNFGILCVFKYCHFALAQLNAVLSALGRGQIEDTLQLIIPLGISFYTFQTMGYLVDVYWNKYPAETNYAKVLLFVSFFPQITQGPISDFKQLTTQLFAEHSFTYHNYSWGCQRILWGFFKKMVLANMLSPYVQDVFANYASYAGITVLIGAFLYSIQIYADFSGYMDIVCGLCEILGIQLTENFERPYFSKSIAEYWRRWHISLGAWFKTYVYYPIAVAKWNQKLGKRAQKHMGKTVGQTIPASVALVFVWLTTGLWHGASWAYIAWGGVNGLFIIFSLWMEPVYDAWKAKLRINERTWSWRAFQTLRTFVLVTFIKVLPEVGSLSDGLGLWKQIFFNHTIPNSLQTLLPFVNSHISILVIGGSTLLLFITSLIQRKMPIRAWFEKAPLAFRMIFFVGLFLSIFYFGIPASGNAGGFMYAQF